MPGNRPQPILSNSGPGRKCRLRAAPSGAHRVSRRIGGDTVEPNGPVQAGYTRISVAFTEIHTCAASARPI